MERWTKVVLLLGVGALMAQEELPGRLVVYDDLIDRFFQIKSWHKASAPTTRPDTVLYLRAEGNIPPLARFPNLQALYLSDIQELDLAALVPRLQRECPKLRILGLEDCDIEDPSPLADLKLQGLLLDDNPITNFQVLGRFRGLKFLSLARTPLTDLTWLSTIPTLQGLDVSETGISDLTPLTKLTQMRMLALYRCTAVSDFSGLLSLNTLEFINISYTNPPAAQPLLKSIHRFPQLKVLQAQGAVSDANFLGALSSLAQIEELTLGQNPAINNLEFARNLRRLLYLDVHRCSVKDLSPLAGLPFLVKLSVGKNQITSIAPLTQCPRLRELYCYENPITDWEKLLEMPGLTYVMLSKKDMPPDRLSALRAQLRKKGVQVDAP